MAQTKFSGPVKSDNGFEGSIVGDVSAAVGNIVSLTSTTASISNLQVGGSLVVSSGWNASSGTASAQVGFIPVVVGGVTKYIALYSSVTL